jgi:hypothetical protein
LNDRNKAIEAEINRREEESKKNTNEINKAHSIEIQKLSEKNRAIETEIGRKEEQSRKSIDDIHKAHSIEVQRLNEKNKAIEAEISRITQLKEEQSKSTINNIEEMKKNHSI